MLKINMPIDDRELTLYVQLTENASQKRCRACGSKLWAASSWDSKVLEAIEEGVKLDLTETIVQTAANQVRTIVRKHALCTPCGDASLCRPWPSTWDVRSTE